MKRLKKRKFLWELLFSHAIMTGRWRYRTTATMRHWWRTAVHLIRFRLAAKGRARQKTVFLRLYTWNIVKPLRNSAKEVCRTSRVFAEYFRLHRMHCIRCGLLLQISHVAWSVYVCVCLWGWGVQKGLNRSRCRFGTDTGRPKKPCVRWVSRSPKGMGQFWGWSAPLKSIESLQQCTQNG